MSPGNVLIWVYTCVSIISCLLVIATILICEELESKSHTAIALLTFTDMTFLTGGFLVLANPNLAKSNTTFCCFQAWYLYTVWWVQVVTFTLFVHYLTDRLLQINGIITGKLVSSRIVSLSHFFIFVFHLSI